MDSIKALLLDIEGTTTPISFVKEVLFPYAYNNVNGFLTDSMNEEEIREAVALLKECSAAESGTDSNVLVCKSNDEESVIISKLTHNVKYWIEKDKKLTALKHLQGLMWRKAYESGQIKSPVFTDVKEVLEVISKSIPIYIYSSGSVEAQQLLFKYSEHGDMTKFIAGYFDTNIGHKVESESYCRIAESIKVPPQNILFLTDIEKEAEAAQSAGVPTMIVKRDGNAPLSPDAEQRFAMTSSFKVLLS